MRTIRFTVALLSLLLLAHIAGAQCQPPGLETFDSLTPGSTVYGITSPSPLPIGWAHDLTVLNSWRADCCGTSSPGTGPSADHTLGGTAAGIYLYTEATGGVPGAEAAVTVCYDATTLVSPTVEFYYHMSGSDMGALEVNQSTDQGVSYTVNLLTITGDQGPEWEWSGNIAVTPDAVTNEVYLQIKGILGPNFNSDIAIDDFLCAEPTPTNWQANTPISSLDINGAEGDHLGPATVNLIASLCTPPVAATGTVTLGTTTNPGALYEIVFSDSSLLPLSLTGLLLGGTQILNIDVASTLSFMNGGIGLSLVPMPLGPFPGGNGTVGISAGFSISSATFISMQALITDVTSPLGFDLSQGTELTITSSVASSVPGPSTDDAAMSINVTQAPTCWASGITFYGTSYTEIWVNPNGRVMFGGGDTDWDSSIPEFLGDNPSVGVWTDFSPNMGGNITVSQPGPALIRVDWIGVPYFAQLSGNSFGIEFDTATGRVSIDGLTGLGAGPSENMLIGISPGLSGGATDPGANALFAPAAIGSVVLATDAIYDFLDLAVPPLPPLLPASLVPGTLTGIDFTDDLAGNYGWTGL